MTPLEESWIHLAVAAEIEALYDCSEWGIAAAIAERLVQDMLADGPT